jgi:maleate cis-trans isomerase
MQMDMQADEGDGAAKVAGAASLLGASDDDGVSDAASDATNAHGNRRRGSASGGRGRGGRHGGGGRGAAKKGKIKRGVLPCRGCKKKFDANECSTSTEFCVPCKRACDRLRDIAKGEGSKAQDKLRHSLACPLKAPRLLGKYFAKTGKPTGARKARGGPKFSLHEYYETLEAETAVESRGQGKMMWEREWVEFAGSTAGGKMSEDAALAKWSEWKQAKELDASSLIWDMDGPKKDSPLQFRVATGKVVDFINRYAHKKGVHSSNKASKKATPEELEKMQKQALSSGETFNPTGASVDFGNMAHKMVSGAGSSTGGGRAFHSDAVAVGAVDDLMATSDEEDDVELEGEEPEESEADKDDVEGKKDGKKGSTPKKGDKENKKWFDRDRLITGSKRQANIKLLALQQACQKTVTDLEQELEAVALHPASAKLQDEVNIAKNRLSGLQKVLMDDAQPLKDYIASFDCAMGAGACGVGRAPPSKSYGLLVTFATMQAKVISYDACPSKASLEEITKSLAELRKPVQALSSATAGALTDLKKAKGQYTNSKKQKAGHEAGISPAKRSKKADIFEHSGSISEPPRLRTGKEVAEFDWATLTGPLLITKSALQELTSAKVTALLQAAADPNSAFCKQLQEVDASLAASQAKSSTPVRAIQAIQDEAITQLVSQFFEGVLQFGDGVPSTTKDPQLPLLPCCRCDRACIVPLGFDMTVLGLVLLCRCPFRRPVDVITIVGVGCD